jgi:putative ABC transport system permease protein
LCSQRSATGVSQKSAIVAFSMGPGLKEQFPGILDYTRIDVNNQYELTYGEKRVFYPRTFFVDTSFLGMFDFPLVEGDRQTALQKPNSIVLTQASARQLFGASDPLGKTVSHFGGDTLLYTVTGILKDVPANSQFQFEALQSYNTVYKPSWMDRGEGTVATYLQLAPHTDVAALEKQFPAYLTKHGAGSKDIHYELFLQSLSDVHAGSVDIEDAGVNFQKFDKRYTGIFMAIGLLVLLIACINFMNLATAQSAERAKEVGIRKTIGALRSQLGIQFLVVALGLLSLVLPYIDKLSGRELSPLLSLHPGLLMGVFLGTVLLGILSGLYPAIYLSSFRPVKVLKGGSETGKHKGHFRNILVVVQFTSAIFLIIATVLIYKQVNYIMTQDPGFDRDEIVTIPLHGITSWKYASLKDELSRSPLITGVTGAQDHLGGPLVTLGFGFWPGDGPMRVLFTSGIFVDPDYLTVYKIPLEAGRNFSGERSAYGNEFIINEMLARKLLADKPQRPLSSLIGKHFGGDTLGRIVDVSKDFNFNSLHYKIEPMFLLDQGASSFSMLSVKINGRQAREAVVYIGSVWKKILPEYPFSYEFLDDHFRELYRTDTQVSRMVAIMAGLAILISCLGLFGLASFSTEKRTKEIGIRKILGASVNDVVFLLSKHFIGLVLTANVIAWPLAWLALHRWIQNYAYRVTVSWWVFAAAGVTALLIAVATVSYHAIHAALSNPVKALRSE